MAPIARTTVRLFVLWRPVVLWWWPASRSKVGWVGFPHHFLCLVWVVALVLVVVVVVVVVVLLLLLLLLLLLGAVTRSRCSVDPPE